MMFWVIEQVENHLAIIYAACDVPDEVAKNNSAMEVARQLGNKYTKAVVKGVYPVDE